MTTIISAYKRHSFAEATMSRYKRIIGPTLRSREPAHQKIEAMVGVDVLNKSRRSEGSSRE